MKLTIVDGFAEGGKYTSELSSEIVDGSPFVILNAINEAGNFINQNRKNIEPSGDAKQRRKAKQIGNDDQIKYCQKQLFSLSNI